MKALPKSKLSQSRKVREEVPDVIEKLRYDALDFTPHDNLDIKDLNLPAELYERLYPHQKLGVRWLYQVHRMHRGCILGDDMGLGKTFQIIAFITGLMRINEAKRVLIICPVSVLQNWQRELSDHLVPHVKRSTVELLSSDISKVKRQRTLAEIFVSQNMKVVVTSYHIVSNMVEEFVSSEASTEARVWDYVILDEGHQIKNPQTKMSKSVQVIRARHRILLTGTPVQNNLLEFWALVDWATKGSILGSKVQFLKDYVEPILLGQDPKATSTERKEAEKAAIKLRERTAPIFLQRKKCEHNEVLQLPEKLDLAVWVPLATKQRKVYEEYLKGRSLRDALDRSTYPVEAINHLKTLCRHPLLLEAQVTKKKLLHAGSTHRKGKAAHGHDDDDCEDVLSAALTSLSLNSSSSFSLKQAGRAAVDEDIDDDATIVTGNMANRSLFEIIGRHDIDVKEILQGSVKLRVLLKLTRRLHRGGHRTLIFSQSRLMLDIIQKVFAEFGLSSFRIDGSVTGRDRQRIIDDFNSGGVGGAEGEDSTGKDRFVPSICLLTTKACGYGITLTGADRVVIYDPSWNPAEDRQAVDRAYRIGQKRNVVVYRFIMASTVEEKMYEKQIFKDGLRVVTESGSSSRYFSREETTALFSLGPPDRSLVMEKLWQAAAVSKVSQGAMREEEDEEAEGSGIKFGDTVLHGTGPGRAQLRADSVSDTGGELPGVLGFTRHDTLYEEMRSEEVRNQQGRGSREGATSTAAAGSRGDGLNSSRIVVGVGLSAAAAAISGPGKGAGSVNKTIPDYFASASMQQNRGDSYINSINVNDIFADTETARDPRMSSGPFSSLTDEDNDADVGDNDMCVLSLSSVIADSARDESGSISALHQLRSTARLPFGKPREVIVIDDSSDEGEGEDPLDQAVAQADDPSSTFTEAIARRIAPVISISDDEEEEFASQRRRGTTAVGVPTRFRRRVFALSDDEEDGESAALVKREIGVQNTERSDHFYSFTQMDGESGGTLTSTQTATVDSLENAFKDSMMISSRDKLPMLEVESEYLQSSYLGAGVEDLVGSGEEADDTYSARAQEDTPETKENVNFFDVLPEEDANSEYGEAAPGDFIDDADCKLDADDIDECAYPIADLDLDLALDTAAIPAPGMGPKEEVNESVVSTSVVTPTTSRLSDDVSHIKVLGHTNMVQHIEAAGSTDGATKASCTGVNVLSWYLASSVGFAVNPEPFNDAERVTQESIHDDNEHRLIPAVVDVPLYGLRTPGSKLMRPSEAWAEKLGTPFLDLSSDSDSSSYASRQPSSEVSRSGRAASLRSTYPSHQSPADSRGSPQSPDRDVNVSGTLSAASSVIASARLASQVCDLILVSSSPASTVAVDETDSDDDDCTGLPVLSDFLPCASGVVDKLDSSLSFTPLLMNAKGASRDGCEENVADEKENLSINDNSELIADNCSHDTALSLASVNITTRYSSNKKKKKQISAYNKDPSDTYDSLVFGEASYDEVEKAL